MGLDLQNRIRKVLNFSDSTLEIYGKLFHLNYSDIEFVGISEVYGVVAFKLNSPIDLKLNIFQKLRYPSIRVLYESQVIEIDIYNAIRFHNSQEYYEFINWLKFQPQIRKEEFVAINNGKFVKDWNYQIDQSLIDQQCPYCEKAISINLTYEPYIIKCPACEAKFLEVFCMKCGQGGFVFNSPKSDLGKVAELDEKPQYWECAYCKNKWKLENSIYQSRQVVAQLKR